MCQVLWQAWYSFFLPGVQTSRRHITRINIAAGVRLPPSWLESQFENSCGNRREPKTCSRFKQLAGDRLSCEGRFAFVHLKGKVPRPVRSRGGARPGSLGAAFGAWGPWLGLHAGAEGRRFPLQGAVAWPQRDHQGVCRATGAQAPPKGRQGRNWEEKDPPRDSDAQLQAKTSCHLVGWAKSHQLHSQEGCRGVHPSWGSFSPLQGTKKRLRD